MAELVDAIESESISKEYGFESLSGHKTTTFYSAGFYVVKRKLHLLCLGIGIPNVSRLQAYAV